jgi:hypothetical protein
MGLTKPLWGAVLVLSLGGGPLAYAQNTGAPPGISAGTELRNIESSLARPGISALERYNVLCRLARLRQLSGDIEGAAQSWLAAATSLASEVPEGSGDAALSGDDALATGAFCLVSLGEWEQAAAVIGPLLGSGRQGPALLRARYLDACLSTWNTGDPSALVSLAARPEYGELKSAVYYTLWKTAPGDTGAETWKARLLAEFPLSPEGRIAASENGGAISARPGPLWLLFPGRGGFSLAAAPAGISATPTAPAGDGNAVPASAVKILQTGLFRGEANARAQMGRLESAGFSPSLTRRAVNGGEFWAVTVPAGQNMNRTIMELKHAGFESFPQD